MATFVAATASASWFNDNGTAPYFVRDARDARLKSTMGEPSTLLWPADSRAAAERSPSLSAAQPVARASQMPHRTTAAPMGSVASGLVPLATPVGAVAKQMMASAPEPETPDVYRAAAARARRVQHELQEAQRFKQKDWDRNGKMNPRELKALLNLDSEEEALAIIARLDTDQDRELDMGELGGALASLRAKLETVPEKPGSVQAAEMARTAARIARETQNDVQVFTQTLGPPSPPRMHGSLDGSAGLGACATAPQPGPDQPSPHASLRATGMAAYATTSKAQHDLAASNPQHASLKATGLAACAASSSHPGVPEWQAE